MKVLGWVLAYWGLWVILGSFLMMVRFKSWCEEWQGIRHLPLPERLYATYGFLTAITFWPREYREQMMMEQFEDDDDDDDDEPPLPQQ